MKALFVLLLFVLGSASLCAQIDWSVTPKPVGVGPSEIFTDPATNRIHVLTSGVDADFNGRFEPGTDDISAAWYVLDPAGNPVDSLFFDGYFNSFPIRVGVNLRLGVMYAPVNGKVKTYSLETQDILEEALIDENLATASYDAASRTLILSARAADFSSPGEIVYFDPEAKLILGRVQAGVNPGNGIATLRPDIGGVSFYSINEGSFGTMNSSITYTSFSSNLFSAVNGEPLGGGGSDILTEGTRAFILMGGTHQVRIVETQTHTEITPSPINIGTEGFDAPRALAKVEDTLIVGTYTSDVRRFNLRTGAMIDVIPTPGKVEAVAVLDSLLFAAIHYTAGTYDPDSLVAVINMNTGEVIDTIVVGALPAKIMVDAVENRVLVVGYGSGENGMPWWKFLDGTTLEPVAEGTLPVALSFPLRAAFIPGENRLVFVGSDTLFSLDVTTAGAIPEPIYTDPSGTGDLFGVSDGGGYWFVTERPKDFVPAPGYLHAIRKSDGVRTAKFITAGDFLLDVAPVPSSAGGGTAAYMLHEGGFGAQNATLALADYAPTVHEGTLGGGANYIMHNVDDHGTEVTAVTMTGTHEVVFLDFTEDGFPAISSRVSTGTTDLDGPRQTISVPGLPTALNKPLLVTTYSGESVFIANNMVMARLETGGKGEGATTLENKIYIANSFETGTYNPGKTVSILSFIFTSVSEAGNVGETSLAQNYPNPAGDHTTIPFTIERAADVSLNLYSASGELVASLVEKPLEAGRHELTLDTKELATGTYLYTLTVGNKTLTKKMEIVR